MKVKRTLRTGLWNSFFQIAFLAIMYAVGRTSHLGGEPTSRFLVLAALVFVPSVIWALFFYFQDRYAPEPLPNIAASFIAGMAAASLGAIPLFRILFRIPEWIYASVPLYVLGSFFIKASMACILLYLVLRYGFLPLKEFDEPVDGMVYGAITGTGFAFVYTLHYLAGHPSFTVYVISFTATINVLIYSSVGSIMGYMIGNAKFQRTNVVVSSLSAMSLGICLLGIYHLISELFFVSGISYAFWICFISVFIYSLIILAYCYKKIRTIGEKISPDRDMPSPKYNFLTSLYIISLFGIAFVLAYLGLLGKTYKNSDYGLSFRYPHSLSETVLTGFAQRPKVPRDLGKILLSAENSSPSFSLTVKAHPNDPHGKAPDPLRYVEAVDLTSFLVENILISGKKTYRVAYSYLEERQVNEYPFPNFIKVYTDILITEKAIFSFTYKAESSHFKEGLPVYDNILKSLEWNE
ncbi:MAG: PrsW family glutamic-type intramembrane protease [Candidatus Aminicenantes bacterium]|jgi:RsiW-degrading membrane proteinase PrsW (M82 family)